MREFVVSAANLDCIDFVAAAILSHLGHSSTIAIDLTRPRSSKSELRHFDPIGSIPIPFCYDFSPDGSVRQLVLPADEFIYGRGRAGILIDQIRKWNGQKGIERYERISRHAQSLCRNGHLSEPTAVVTALLASLQLGTIVSERRSRILSAYHIAKLTSRLENYPLTLTDDSAYRFAQGGYILSNGQRYEFLARLDGILHLKTTSGFASPLSSVFQAGSVELGGPLDAIAMCTDPSQCAGHLPYYTERTPDSHNSHSIPTVEMCRSLFFRYPESRPWLPSHQPTMVSVQDYLGAQTFKYLGMSEVDCESILGSINSVVSSAKPTHERWAWSQASIGTFVQDFRKASTPPNLSGGLAELFDTARRGDALATKAYAEGLERFSVQISTYLQEVDGAFNTAEGLIATLHLPIGYFPERSYSLLYLRGRLNDALGKQSGSKETLSNARFIAWELVRTSLSALILFADTSLRASLPWIALFLDAKQFGRAVDSNSTILRQRAENKCGFRVV